jgi:hypothetical protein
MIDFSLNLLHVLCKILQYVKDTFTQLKNAFHGLDNSDNHQFVWGPAVLVAYWQLSTHSTLPFRDIFWYLTVQHSA